MQTITSATGSRTHTLALIRVPQRRGQSGLVVIGTTGYVVEKTDNGYIFGSDAGQTHEVELWGPRVALCDCGDFRFRRGPCKHVACARAMELVTTDALTI